MSLPARWTPLRFHATQNAYWTSPHRFNVVPAGRRSGKTELAKRKLVKKAIAACFSWPARYFAGAPTRDQAKRIFWEDLKALSPPELVYGTPRESDLTIAYIGGSELSVIGMDKPQRIEGSPWDGGILDEFANMKPTAWGANVRPALADRNGWCDLIGVPEGRNHYYDLHQMARAHMLQYAEDSEWGTYTWISADILPEEEIEAAKSDLDDLTYQQEYEASFINFTGRAYYPFLEATHTAKLKYDPLQTLALCFDFNVEPGVAAVVQEQRLPRQGGEGTGVIGEVYIERNSNTPAVCRRLIQDWGEHQGRVICYGDATGGSRGSAKVEGSDWDLIRKELYPVFGDRLSFRVKDANPAERSRINAVNSRLCSSNGNIRLLVDGYAAPHVVKDLEGVTLLKGGSGEIDKKASPQLTHLSDGLGYYIEYNYPVVERVMHRVTLGGV